MLTPNFPLSFLPFSLLSDLVLRSPHPLSPRHIPHNYIKMKAGLLLLTALSTIQAFLVQPLAFVPGGSCVSSRSISSAAPSFLSSTGSSPSSSGAPAAGGGPFFLADLPYSYDSLEPHVDGATLRLHHGKHHATYVANLNKAYTPPSSSSSPSPSSSPSIMHLQSSLLDAPSALKNNAGQHYNHALYWECMTPGGRGETGPSPSFMKVLSSSSYGSLQGLKDAVTTMAAPGVAFGSAWVWVCYNTASKKIEVVQTTGAVNPLMDGAFKDRLLPVLVLDVWEHAYYLKYQNRRPEYVTAWWNVVNWKKVSENLEHVIATGEGVPVKG